MKNAGKRIVPLLLLLGIGVAVWHVWSADRSQPLALYGNVDQRQIELAFLDAERLKEVLVQEGMEVQPGQVLARLETRRLRDRIAVVEAQVAASEAALARLENGTRPEEIAQARASLSSAMAEKAFADSQYRRTRSLWTDSGGKAVKKQDLDEALRLRDVAGARQEQARNALRLAELGPRAEDIAEAQARQLQAARELQQLRNQLDDAELKSPARSVINRRLMEPGDMALPQKAVFSLSVLSPKWVRAYISEKDLGRIRPGMPARIHTDSHPDKSFEGSVTFIASVAEFTPKTVQTPELRTSLVYEVRVAVADPQNRLRLGMPATVLFPDLRL